MVNAKNPRGLVFRAAVFLISGVVLLSLGVLLRSDKSSPGTWQNLSPTEARELLNSSENVILLDVREDFEFWGRRIPGSVHLPLGELVAGGDQALEQGKTYIIVCRTGNRSQSAAQYLAEQSNDWIIYNLQGGIMAWPYETEGGDLN